MEEMQHLPKPKVFISIGPGENGGKGAPRGVCQSYSLSQTYGNKSSDKSCLKRTQ
jgi:hypothetical protein